MSFAQQTKNELARIIPVNRCCCLAELAALIRLDGVVQLSGGRKIGLKVTTGNAAVARKIIKLAKQLFDLQTEVLFQRLIGLSKKPSYLIQIPFQPGMEAFLSALGLLDEKSRLVYRIKGLLVRRQCCRRAYLRGAFLGAGSVNKPEGNYHLEIITRNEHHARFIGRLASNFDMRPRTSSRKNWFVVYLKESEQIILFLNIIGAHSALLNLENARLMKEVRNQVNREVNCETANLNKTVDAGLRQVESIRMIRDRLGLENLPIRLREVARLRLEYPESSLKELGEMMQPKLGKSGINHRIRKLEEIAAEIRTTVKP